MVGEESNDTPKVTRDPTLKDFVKLCAALNDAGAKYIVIGGFAVNFYGRSRATTDIDFLVSSAPENVERLKKALSILEDNAAADIKPNDVAELTVVRVMDEVVVDLLAAVGDVTFDNAEAITAVINGVSIPVADLSTLIKTKRGYREKDKDDLRFLLQRAAAQPQTKTQKPQTF